MSLKKNILLVEDDPFVGADLADRLQSLGFRVLGPFRSGEEALIDTQSAKIDLGLLDIELCGRMDGIELARKLQNRQPLPTIFLSKLQDDHTLQEMLQVSYTAFIGKPFNDMELKAAIFRAFQHQSLSITNQEPTEEKGDLVFLNNEGQLCVKLQKINNKGSKVVELSDICYFEASAELVTVTIGKGDRSLRTKNTLKYLEGKLCDENSFFIRINKQMIINLQHIDSINKIDGKESVFMKNIELGPFTVNRSYKTTFNKRLPSL